MREFCEPFRKKIDDENRVRLALVKKADDLREKIRKARDAGKDAAEERIDLRTLEGTLARHDARVRRLREALQLGPGIQLVKFASPDGR